MSRPTLLAAAALATLPVERAIQGSRSYSFSSSTSSAYSRAPEDLVDRLACHQVCLLFSSGLELIAGFYYLPIMVSWKRQDPEA
jgi:hypothetical protein